MVNIYKKMNEVMKEIGAIGKNQKNQAQGFKFRGIDDMLNNLYPALIKHGVFITPRCTSEAHELKEVTRSSGKTGVDKHVTILMEYDFFAEDGSKVTVGPIPAEGLDSGDKATNKALSAALKYALIQTFSIPTEDMEEADLTTPVIGTTSKTKTDKIVENSLIPLVITDAVSKSSISSTLSTLIPGTISVTSTGSPLVPQQNLKVVDHVKEQLVVKSGGWK